MQVQSEIADSFVRFTIIKSNQNFFTFKLFHIFTLGIHRVNFLQTFEIQQPNIDINRRLTEFFDER